MIGGNYRVGRANFHPECPLCKKPFRPRTTVLHSELNIPMQALQCPCGAWIAHHENQKLLKMDFSVYTYDREEESWVTPYATKHSYEKLVRSLEKFRRYNRWLDVGCGAGHLLRVVKAAD